MIIPPFTKTYGRRTVLRTPQLTFDPGKIYVLIGPNGSGKSTFARITAGVLDPDEKNGKHVSDGVIRYMPQKSYPFRMSVRRNIMLSGGDPERAEELIRRLNLTAIEQQKISSLSGGETARMARVRVLKKPSDLLILAEPTSAMDMESAMISEQLITEYRNLYGSAVLLVTHDLSQARRLADEVLFFQEGELYEYGPAEKLLYHPQKEITRRFLEFYGSLAK